LPTRQADGALFFSGGSAGVDPRGSLVADATGTLYGLLQRR
jgi:hypothetical protein